MNNIPDSDMTGMFFTSRLSTLRAERRLSLKWYDQGGDKKKGMTTIDRGENEQYDRDR
jgi:hypothetical protein